MKCSLQTIHLLQTHLGLLRTITMQQEAFVLQHTDTCFSGLDIIAILPLFSIGATSISVAVLSELSEAPGRLRGSSGSAAFVKRFAQERAITRPAEPKGSVLLLEHRVCVCHLTDLT